MKKLIKTMGIIILVVCAIAGTAYLFYSNLTKDRDSFAAAVSYQKSASKKETYTLLTTANNLSGVGRFAEFVLVINKLNGINDILTPYLLKAEDYSIDQNEICDRIERVVSAQSTAKRALNEYVQKSKLVPSFEEIQGANPVINYLGAYVVSYSKYLNKINSEIINGYEFSDDMKFYAIQIYLNVVENTFNNIKEIANVNKLVDTSNFNAANNCFIGGYKGNYSANVNLFIKNYEKCDANELSQKFATLYSAATTTEDVATNAVYYLKAALGV